jgi:hypothetical protein
MKTHVFVVSILKSAPNSPTTQIQVSNQQK